MRQYTREYDVDDGYVPTKAVIEVMELLDHIDEELKAKDKLDNFLANVASHSKECLCSHCEKTCDSDCCNGVDEAMQDNGGSIN